MSEMSTPRGAHTRGAEQTCPATTGLQEQILAPTNDPDIACGSGGPGERVRTDTEFTRRPADRTVAVPESPRVDSTARQRWRQTRPVILVSRVTCRNGGSPGLRRLSKFAPFVGAAKRICRWKHSMRNRSKEPCDALAEQFDSIKPVTLDTRSPTHSAVVGGPPHGVDAASNMLKPRCPGEG